MAHKLINKNFYHAIISFEESDEAQDYYYQVMNAETGKTGKTGRPETETDRKRGRRQIRKTDH